MQAIYKRKICLYLRQNLAEYGWQNMAEYGRQNLAKKILWLAEYGRIRQKYGNATSIKERTASIYGSYEPDNCCN